MQKGFTTKTVFTSLLIAFAATQSHAQLVTTFAGNPTAGAKNDTGIAASFNWPINIALDNSKVMYVADAENHCIRKVSPARKVTTFVGAIAGYIDDTLSAARLNHPLGVAVDASGTVYVADSKNNMIRKVTPAGRVTTLAGSQTAGSADGTGTTASFNYPNGIALDASGNLYVGDALNNMIRKVTPTGVVTTLAGSLTGGNTNGQGTAATFNYPTGIAVDALGNVFVADENNHLIRKITAGGMVSTFAGAGFAGSDDDTGIAASFFQPYGIAIDAASNLYVAEIGNHLIRKITPARKVMTIAGNAGNPGADDGLKTNATFNSPTGIVMDGTSTMYVADWKNNEIRKIDLTVTGVFTNHTSGQLALYPNPATNAVNIPAANGTQVTIYNLMGAQVFNTTATGNALIVSVKDFPAGMYSVLAVARDGRKAFGKFVKQ